MFRWMCIALLAVALAASTATATLVNTDVTRSIDVSSQLVNVLAHITVKNTGSAAVSSYEIEHDAALKPYLSFVQVATKIDDESTPVPMDGDSVKIDIAAGAEIVLEFTAIYTHALRAFPAKITQKEPQMVLFTANTYFSTPYATEEQKTTVSMSDGKTENHSVHKPTKISGKTITYGPYKNIAADAKDIELSVHFENNTPFMTATNLARDIEVSHWGNVAIIETVDLKHTGAELKGTFSRLDFQRDPSASKTCVKTFVSNLPAAATDVYYIDVIGNVSTSNMRADEDAVVMEIRPRFPLFGGWKTQYTVGYNMAAHNVLSRSGSKFTLRIPFVDHIYDNQVIDTATISIALPEGATNIEFSAPFSVDSSNTDGVLKSYLDTVGRPILTISKSNLVEEHIQELEVTYTFSQASLVREPLMVVVFIFVLLLSVIVVNRINFNIDTSSPEYQKEVARQKAAGLIEQLGTNVESATVTYQSYYATAGGKANKNGFTMALTTIKALKKSNAAAAKQAQGDEALASILSTVNGIVKLENSRADQFEKSSGEVDERVQSNLLEKDAGKVNEMLTKL